MGNPAFQHSASRIAPGIVRVEVQGYLDAASSTQYLVELKRIVDAARQLDQRPIGLMFKESLVGFDTGKVARTHGQWIDQMGQEISSVAIVSTKASVRFGVVAAKLVTRRPIEVFPDEEAAFSWLETAPARLKSAQQKSARQK